MIVRDAMVQPATAAQVSAFAVRKGVGESEAARVLEAMRERQIALRAEDPFTYGYEPPIWYVAKALVRNPAWSDYERSTIRRRAGSGAEEFAEAMRRRLGFEHAVTKLLIMGSNRSGKTDFAMKFCMQTAMQGGKKIFSGAQTLKTQKKIQMPRLWHYMPQELKAKNVATKKATDIAENISYTEKNGFAGSRIIYGNGSSHDWGSYEQHVKSLEGSEYDLAHLDEEYPKGHYDLYTTRVTSRAGVFMGTFTPLHGYTSAVAAFLDGAVATMWHRAYLRPKDGGPREPWMELNLERSEYEALVAWRKCGMVGDCNVPESRPEDCFRWLEGTDGTDEPYTGPGPDGRVFDWTPRVAVCQGGDAAAIWFYGSDNPYGLPAELIATKSVGEGSDKRILASVYGVAEELKGKMFKASAVESAIVDDAEIPKRLVRVMVCDPSPERNWCFGWFGLDPATGILYWYREWPGGYEVPGQGAPGAWAVVSDRNEGLNDGDRGDGQISFGWSYQQIFDEVERVEDGEKIAFRIMDSRAASQSKISKTSNRTLIEDVEEYCDGWQVADGQRVEIGYTRIQDKLTAGKIRIARSCVNAIACLKMLTGKDGQKGACKDFVDLLRYVVMSDIWNYGEEEASEGQGGPQTSPEAPVARGRERPKRRVWW